MAFLTDAEKGKSNTKDVTGRVRLVERETKNGVLFESLDVSQPSAVPLRKNYLNYH
jgi:hypothetical protein